MRETRKKCSFSPEYPTTFNSDPVLGDFIIFLSLFVVPMSINVLKNVKIVKYSDVKC